MFNDGIFGTPFTSSIANKVFPRIIGDDCRSKDESMLATMRALVAPRLEDKEVICIRLCRNLRDVEYTSTDTLTIAEGRNSVINSLNTEQLTSHGYRLVEKISVFFKNHFDINCWINQDNHSTICFVSGIITLPVFHHLQAAIPVMLPWIFQDKPLADDERRLINSLTKTSSAEYVQCINELAAKIDMRSMGIHAALHNFQQKILSNKIKQIKDDISMCDGSLAQLMSEIGEKIKHRDEQLARLYGYEHGVQTDDFSVEEYFLRNKNIDLTSMGSDGIEFIVKGKILYFDPDAASRYINNPSTSWGSADPNIRKLAKELFATDTPKMFLRTAAMFKLNFVDNAISPMRYTDELENLQDVILNPHLCQFSCMGNYSSGIAWSLIKHEYITAIEQCVASCANLNWCDSVVMGALYRDFERNITLPNKCIELLDGTTLSMKEAVEWIDAQQGGIQNG